MSTEHTPELDELDGDVETPDEAPEPDGTVEDFDAFWTRRKGKRVRIMGEVVELPPSVPLAFEMEARAMRRSSSTNDVARLVAVLFGADALDRWVAAGMDGDQLAVLLAWAPRRIEGEDVTLEQVARELAEYEAEQARKAAERKAGKGKGKGKRPPR